MISCLPKSPNRINNFTKLHRLNFQKYDGSVFFLQDVSCTSNYHGSCECNKCACKTVQSADDDGFKLGKGLN